MSGKRMSEGNWEISVTSPSRLEVDPELADTSKLSPGHQEESLEGNTLNMDDCWRINIKAPASLNVKKGEPTEDGYQETIISEGEDEKGEFLSGPEWKVRITTKIGQDLDVQQLVDDSGEHRVLISPIPPKIIKKEEKVLEKIERKVPPRKNEVKINIKKGDDRYLYSGGKIFFRECPLYHKVGWTSASA
ncbi:uncharacterized protein LOC111714293 [Eurytemora carolleeae]|uniref:uncharacterized protein LOC111714293 n=1 Tax=Eurytemora carolleeae TaxID=1294199 RepID=UPI000C784ADB|nr:uncharacterized protein LOC111714293 [Eurytemora carolleeae]XP_023345134.1 uncharacterized protein LOC111714293 [Eurytemora carolleeae]|eukprot:XP_023345133.1 uncharacterized protein LOC111714293 [Eurytemora affinis]